MPTILYRDERLVAVHKPSGLLVHRSMLDRHETRFALQLVRDMTGRRVHPVHRLDRATSGLLVFTFDPEATASRSAALAAGRVSKRYLAVVRGHPAESGVIDHPIMRRDDEAGREHIEGPLQDAVTHFRRLAATELPVRVDRYPTSRYALLELDPKTGRRHQLRRHLKHISHPIIGDTTWGKSRHNRMFAERFGASRLLLACTSLRLPHPDDGSMLALDCPLEENFMQVVQSLDWSHALSDTTVS